MIKYDKKPGNAGCTKCGLRASSKNVQIRSVFVFWPDNDHRYNCESMENCIVTKHNVEWDSYIIPMVGIKPWTKYKETDKTPDLGQLVEEMIKVKLTGSEIRSILCDHTWKQDPGTNTV